MKMLIDGEWLDASDKATAEIRNPATDELIDTVPRATAEDVERAITAAQDGQRRMAALPSHERCAILMRVAELIEKNREDLAQLLTRENAKVLRDTREEIQAAAEIFRGYAEEAKRLFGRTIPLDSVSGLDRSIAFTVHEPRGVVVAIVPFNYPVELWSHKAAAALAAGNAVITKPPGACPLTLLRIAKYFGEAGLPRGGYQVVTGAGETVGAQLVRSDRVQMIAMTGSTQAGCQIARDAAATLKKVQLELGGNDATIICDDTDPEAVADDLIAGRFTRGNGQICCAVKRVLVDRKLYDRLLAALVEKTRKLRLGNPLDPLTDVGPLISESAARIVEEQISRAKAEGAKIAAGGKRSGAFIEPTILTDLRPGAEVFQEEVFGPVLPLIAFDTFDEALALANQTQYGLQAAIFTTNVTRIMRAFRELHVGTVIVNHNTAIRVASLPFGGTKMSGNAREGFHDTLIEMTEQRTLLLSDVFDPRA